METNKINAHQTARFGQRSVDVLLTICPPWDIQAPPIGIGFLHSYLKEKGFHPALLDLNIEIYHRMSETSRGSLFGFDDFIKWEGDYESETESFEPHVNYAIERILSFKASVVGFSLYHSNMDPSFRIARRLKEVSPKTIIVFGGSSCTDRFDRDKLPYDVADYVVLGEGELPLAQMLTLLLERRSVDDIQGVITSEENFIRKPAVAEPIVDLDNIPSPTYEGLDLSLYTLPGMMRIMGSRGCICRCNFCNETYWVKRFRYRSGGHIVQEMLYFHESHRSEHFKFSDLVLNGSLKALSEQCDILIDLAKPMFWYGQAVLRKNMTAELLQKMFKSGCRAIDYGMESGSNSVLKRMRKPYTSEIAARVLRATVEAGIQCGINIIVGFPGETDEEFNETLTFLANNRDAYHKIANLSACLITPHSDIDNNPGKYGVIMPPTPDFWYNWEDTNQNNNATNAQRKKKLQAVIDFAKREGITIEYVYAQ